MNEATLQAAVIDLAHVMGFRVAHFRPARIETGWRTPVSADGRGFPDLVIAKPGRVLFVELKGSAGRVSPAQQEWIDVLGAQIWSPAQWNDGTILAALKGAI